VDSQSIINWAFAALGALISFILKVIWDAVKDLQTSDKELADKVQHIEVLVAGQYVKRDDMDKLGTAIFTKLDRIEAKLDGKVDK
jgi:hypothetical protein